MIDAGEAARTAERVARDSYGRLLAFLAARTRDVAGAEDALSESFAAALRMWPVDGVPDNPDAWHQIAGEASCRGSSYHVAFMPISFGPG